MSKMKVEIWSDIACPYCYIGKRKFENALAKFSHSDEIEIVWHSYELNPDLPRKATGITYYDYFAETHDSTPAEAKRSLQGMVDLAKEVGLEYNFEKLIVANTFDALRLIKLAKKHKLADQAEEVLFKAYFVEGKNISDRSTLVALGTSIGLQEAEINDVLNSDEFVVDIEADIRYSEDELDLEFIPFYLFNGKDVIQGSLAEEEYLEVLNQSYNDWKINGVAKGGGGDRFRGGVCSPDGTCSI